MKYSAVQCSAVNQTTVQCSIMQRLPSSKDNRWALCERKLGWIGFGVDIRPNGQCQVYCHSISTQTAAVLTPCADQGHQLIGLLRSQSVFLLTWPTIKLDRKQLNSWSQRPTRNPYISLVFCPRTCSKRHPCWYIFQTLKQPEYLRTRRGKPRW